MATQASQAVYLQLSAKRAMEHRPKEIVQAVAG